jgi:hypothetical protein
LSNRHAAPTVELLFWHGDPTCCRAASPLPPQKTSSAGA